MKYRFLALFFILFAVGCSHVGLNKASDAQGWPAQRIYQSGQAALVKHNYRAAITYFEALNLYYPFGKFAENTQKDLMMSYYKDNQNDMAQAVATRYIHLYPRGKYINYAYHLRGVIQDDSTPWLLEKLNKDNAGRDLTAKEKALRDFQFLVRFYPKSAYAPDAKARIQKIQNTLAKHQLRVAQFYFQRKSYVAAINRAQIVVQHYAMTDLVSSALRLIMSSYQAMHLPQKSAQTQGLLAKFS